MAARWLGRLKGAQLALAARSEGDAAARVFRPQTPLAPPRPAVMRPQVEQLKEEIGVKDLALVKEHFDHMKVGGRRRQGGAGR